MTFWSCKVTMFKVIAKGLTSILWINLVELQSEVWETRFLACRHNKLAAACIAKCTMWHTTQLIDRPYSASFYSKLFNKCIIVSNFTTSWGPGPSLIKQFWIYGHQCWTSLRLSASSLFCHLRSKMDLEWFYQWFL